MAHRQTLLLTLLLGMVVALDPLSIDIALPAATVIAEGLGTDLSSVQLSVSLFVLGMAAGQLFHGPASDRFGRRPVMLGALCLYVAATLVVALAPGIEVLIAGRLVQGFAAAATQTVSRAIIRDRLDREAAARVLSYVFLVLALAPVVAPAVGAYLTATVGWRAVFWVMIFYGAFALALHAGWLRETNAHRDPHALDPARLVRAFATPAVSPVFWAYAACSASTFSVLFAFLVGAPAALIVFLGATPGAFSLYFAIVMLGNLVGFPTSARLVGRLGLDRLLMVGTFGGLASALALAILALAGVDTVAAIVVPVMFYMFFFALILPASTAGALSPFPRAAGAASALLGFVQLGAAALTGALVGALDDGTHAPMVAAIAVAAVAGAAAYGAVRISRTRRGAVH